MDNNKLCSLLFEDNLRNADEIKAQYKKRELPEGAKVTRMAPSPTGFMHLGNLFAALTSERLARQSGGVFYLRIEDTDQKREVEGGVGAIIESLSHFGLSFDEGASADGDRGDYGPYRQRQRADIYRSFARELVSLGKAYPCFCTEDDLNALRERQEAQKEDNLGYNNKWAVCRSLTIEQIEERLAKNIPYVIRLKSQGNPDNKFKFTDLIKGDLNITENDMDIVLLKSDGIPTYHFAHIIDDYLMGTTHVVRGDEWLATLPIHLQLFRETGLKAPKYMHIAPLMKMEGEAKRKLSKRKDPELALDFYKRDGYMVNCVMTYLMTLLNSNFEEWATANPEKSYKDFPFSPKKMSVSGALFDLVKLDDVSKNEIAKLSNIELYNALKEYTAIYDKPFFELITKYADKTKEILNIGRTGGKPRKDIAKLSQIKDYISYFFDEIFWPEKYSETLAKDDCINILREYKEIYSEDDSQDEWFNKIKALGEKYGYTSDMKEYKKNPESFKGNVAHVSAAIRTAVTGRENTPDTYLVFKTMGTNLIKSRLEIFLGRKD